MVDHGPFFILLNLDQMTMGNGMFKKTLHSWGCSIKFEKSYKSFFVYFFLSI